MDDVSAIPFQPEPVPQDLKPHTKLILASDIVKAVKLVLCGIPVVIAGLYLWTHALDLDTVLNLFAGLVLFAFGLVTVPHMLALFFPTLKNVGKLLYPLIVAMRSGYEWWDVGAVIQATLEIALDVDLNKSGHIGDVVRQIEQPKEEVKETIRFVPTNRKPSVVLAPDGTEIPKEDFVEFVRGLETTGLTRSKWVSENKKGASFKFASGRVMDRPTYDAACDILEKRARVLHGRRQGTGGTLTATPETILNILGLD